MQVLSWAPYRPGLVEASTVLWREVRNADLTPEFDVTKWLRAEVEAEKLDGSVAFLTSRDLSKHHLAQHETGGIEVNCLATVGLGNAERVGHRVATRQKEAGTINVLAVVDAGLTEAALLEGISIATEARTLAITEAARALPTGLATGTGTDCIALAAPIGSIQHIGKHTGAGEALGRAVFNAVSAGAKEWMEEYG